MADIDPVNDLGEIKTAEDCFLEAYHAPENGNGSIRKMAAAKSDDWNSASTRPSWYAMTLINKYDKEWFEWEPETLWQTIEKDFRVLPDDLARNKIGAAKVIFLTDAFWKEWPVFEKIVQIFNGGIPDFTVVDVPSPAESAWAVGEAVYMRPGNTFSDEVISYVQAVCKDAGLVLYPKELEFAQPKPLGRLASDVRGAWEMIEGQKKVDIVENELGVNLARLQAIQAYVQDRKNAQSN